MLKTQSLTTDILVVGSGIAGIMAAIEARKAGANVVLVSKSALGRECSTSYARTFMIYQGEYPGVKDIPGYDDKPGKYIEDKALVRTILEEAPRQIENLVSLGVPMELIPPHGSYDLVTAWRPKGSEHTHGGAIVLDILAPVAKSMGILIFEGCSMMSLLNDGDRTVGASGLLSTGSWLSVYARGTILATGGAAGISEVTCTSKQVAGNGYAMALKAGLHLKSMEFNSFYPVGLPTPTGRYVHCAPVTLTMKNALLLNDNGEDVVEKHFGISLQEGVPLLSVRFDWLPRAVASELATGKVWLDLTRVPADEWDKLPERNWKQIRQTQVDMRNTPVPIVPMSIQFYGGMITDTGMRTSTKGLYAAGEATAGWKAEGTIKGGIGHMRSCLAMGSIAGRSAAAAIQGVKVSSEKTIDEGLQQAQAILGRAGEVSAEEIQEETRRVVYGQAGPVKSKGSLQEGLEKLESLEKQCGQIGCRSFQELGNALEAEAMLLTSKAMLCSALLRTESRGGFYRRDFPDRNDDSWLRPVLVYYNKATSQLRAEPGNKVAY